MKKVQKYFLFFIVITILVAVFAYNTWSYRCGHCTLSSLLSFSAPAIFLFVCNMFALIALIVFRLRNGRNHRKQLCSCGSQLSSAWIFCPSCGRRCSDIQYE